MTRNATGRMPTPAEAFAALGLYGGDDGLSAGDPANMEKAAQMLGQELKAVRVVAPRPVKFLARIYGPEVWEGAPDSCCDLPRQLAKFHTTVSLPISITPEMKLVEKCRSFLLTDANTPIMGLFCKRVMQTAEALGVASHSVPDIVRWNVGGDDPDQQYPNEDCIGWMLQEAMESLPEFDIDGFYDWMHLHDGTLSYFLKPPLFMERKKPKIIGQVVVDGEYNAPLPHAKRNEPVRGNAAARRRIARKERSTGNTRPSTSNSAG